MTSRLARPTVGLRSALVVGAPFAGIAIGLAATVSPRLVVVGTVGLVLLALMLTDLTVGVAFFTVTTFFQLTPGGAPLALSKPLGLVLVLAWAAALLRDRRHVPVLWDAQPGVSGLLLAFFSWSCVSILWAQDVARVQASAIRLLLSVVFLLVVFSAVRTVADLRRMAWAFVIGTAATTVYGALAGLSLGGRFTGGMSDPNYLAAALVSAAAIGGFLLAAGERGWRRVVLIALLAVFASALVATQSRGGIVAIAVTLATALALGGSFRRRALALVLAVAVIGVGFYAFVAPSSLRERATNISSSGSAGRTDAWQVAIRITQDHPVAGVGLDNYPVAQGAYISDSMNLLDVYLFRALQLVAHNTYLQMLSEIGVIGFGLFCALVAVPLAGALRVARSTRDRPLEALTRGFVVGMVGLLTAYFFLSGLYEKQLWLLLGILAAIPAVAAASTLEHGPPEAEG